MGLAEERVQHLPETDVKSLAAHDDLANALMEDGKYSEAEMVCRKVLALKQRGAVCIAAHIAFTSARSGPGKQAQSNDKKRTNKQGDFPWRYCARRGSESSSASGLCECCAGLQIPSGARCPHHIWTDSLCSRHGITVQKETYFKFVKLFVPPFSVIKNSKTLPVFQTLWTILENLSN